MSQNGLCFTVGIALDILRVLVIEDHDFQRKLLEQMLRSMSDVQLTSVASGKQALQMLRDSRFDIVISDLMMPEIDGIELISMYEDVAPGIALVLSSVDGDSLQMAVAIAKSKGVRLLGAIPKPLSQQKLALLFEEYRAGT